MLPSVAHSNAFRNFCGMGGAWEYKEAAAVCRNGQPGYAAKL